MNSAELEDDRRHAAEAELETYDFGDHEFVDSGGWAFDSRSDRLEKPIFMKAPERNDEDDTRLGVFVVEFETGCAAVIDTEARMDGHEIGCRGATVPAPGR